MRKAVHEEGRHSSWVDPDPEWDAAVESFCHRLLADGPFLAELVPFAEDLALAGARSSIGQLVLRLTTPGVPDIYGGDELWYLALVDPDNRRPVDWARRRDALARLDAGGDHDRGTVKLWVIREALALRARRPEAFEAPHEPLEAGPGTCAFRRGELVVAVPLGASPPEFDRPPGRFRDVLAGVERSLGGYAPALLEPI
jgi:(1->4)-alpha-D-glucan 1-alpha-D-glucosylmutase